MKSPTFVPTIALSLRQTSFTASAPSRHPAATAAKSSRTIRPESMRASRERREENTAGNIFVDTSCIDCDTCRWLSPTVFHHAGSQSAVHTQPQTADDSFTASQAMSACPTGSIRAEHPVKQSREAARSFPIPALDARGNAVDENTIFYNGFSSPDTFGASSWFVRTPDGNIMFDCPRYFEPLAKRIDELGGVDFIVLSHKDDVAGHVRWADRFGARRVIHEVETNRHQETDACEIKLSDGDFPHQLMPGIELIHVPGHSRGCIAMLHRDTKSLFTGDHIAYSVRTGGLSAFPRYTSYSWDAQMESIRGLVDVEFLHGFPGHARAFHFTDAEDRRKQLLACANQFSDQRVALASE